MVVYELFFLTILILKQFHYSNSSKIPSISLFEFDNPIWVRVFSEALAGYDYYELIYSEFQQQRQITLFVMKVCLA